MLHGRDRSGLSGSRLLLCPPILTRKHLVHALAVSAVLGSLVTCLVCGCHGGGDIVVRQVLAFISQVTAADTGAPVGNVALELFGTGLSVFPASVRLSSAPRASSFLSVYNWLDQSEKDLSYQDIFPFYIRRSDAEEKRSRAQK